MLHPTINAIVELDWNKDEFNACFGQSVFENVTIEQIYYRNLKMDKLTPRERGFVLANYYLFRNFNMYEIEIRQGSIDELEDLINRTYFKESAKQFKMILGAICKAIESPVEILNYLKCELIEIISVKTDFHLNPGIPFLAGNPYTGKDRMEFVLKMDELFFNSCLDIVNQEISKYNQENLETTQYDANSDLFEFKIADQERFVYCERLGIIKHLRDLLNYKKQNVLDYQVYRLLSLITGIKTSTVKRLMPFANNPNNSDSRNPFNNIALMERIDRNLTNNDLGK